MTNPFAEPDQKPPSDDESARTAFLAWEGLRLVYNGVLVVMVVVYGWPHLAERQFLRTLAWCFLWANLCFCTGPVAEGYLVLVGVDRHLARFTVFVPGLMLGCGLTLFAVGFWNFRLN